MLQPLALACAVALLACCTVAHAAGNKVLVLLEDDRLSASHSRYLDALRAAGLSLHVKTYRAKGLALREYDTWHYDHLLLLAPKAESKQRPMYLIAGGFGDRSCAPCDPRSGLACCPLAVAGFAGGSIDLDSILEFVDSGRNLVLAASSQASDLVRSLAAEVGVDLDDRGTAVYDHIQHAQGPSGAADHTLIIANDVVRSKAIFGDAETVKVCVRACMPVPRR
jgi:oligosaccharyltransferase complex subunit beta